MARSPGAPRRTRRSASKTGKATKAAGAAAKAPGNRTRTATPGCNSFVPGTPVLMADGTTKPIEDVAVGDLVLATVEMTGLTAAFPVTDLIRGTGQKHLVRITANGETTIATLAHPYYLADERRWIPAGSLSPGDRLLRPDGTEAIVEMVSQFTVLRTRVHNLTIGTAHTYYAGADPVLVHNCPGDGSDGRTYNRRRDYGGSQTDSPAARKVREEAEGRDCPSCGKPMESGTKTAPSPQHDPPLSSHYENGGRDMTDAERRAYARSERSLNGANCITCQRREGQRIAAERRRRNRAD